MKNRMNTAGYAILSVALLTVMAGAAVSPAIAAIAQAFPETGSLKIGLILTLTPLFVIPASLTAHRLTGYFGKKRTLLAALFLYLVSGAGAGLCGSVDLMLVCRALLGLAVGIIMPLSTSMVSDYFSGESAKQMMGWISASNHLGGMTAQIVSGVLATILWRYAFAAYLLAALAIVMVMLFIPASESESREVKNEKRKLPGAVYLCGLAMFVLMLAFYTVPVNLAFLVEQKSLGSSAAAGIAGALVTGAAFFMGIFFLKIFNRIRSFTLIAVALIAVGTLCLSLSSLFCHVLLGVVCIGLGEGFVLPLIFHHTGRSAGEGLSVKAFALVSSMMFLGQFCSPVIIRGIGILTAGRSGDPYMTAFYISVAAAAILSLPALYTNIKKLKTGKRVSL